MAARRTLFVLGFMSIVCLALTNDSISDSDETHRIVKRHGDGDDSMSHNEIEDQHRDLKKQLHKMRRHRKRSERRTDADDEEDAVRPPGKHQFDGLTSTELDEKRVQIENQLAALSQRRKRNYDKDRDCCAKCIEKGDSIVESPCCNRLQTQTCPHLHHDKCSLYNWGTQTCPYTVPSKCGIPDPTKVNYDKDRRCCEKCISNGDSVDESACCQRIKQQPCPYINEEKCPETPVSPVPEAPPAQSCPYVRREKCGIPTVNVVTRRVPQMIAVTQSPELFKSIERIRLNQLTEELRVYREQENKRVNDLEWKARYDLENDLRAELDRIVANHQDEIRQLNDRHQIRRADLEDTLRQQRLPVQDQIDRYASDRRFEVEQELNRIKVEFDKTHQASYDIVEVVRVDVGEVPRTLHDEPAPPAQPLQRLPEPPPRSVSQCCNRCASQSCGESCPLDGGSCVQKPCDRCRCNHAFVNCN